MPFLTLNNIVIPTSSQGGTISRTLYGEYSAGYDGTAQNDVRSRKKVWEFTTKPISPQRAAALVGLIEGNGLNFSFNNSSTYLFASNGIGASGITGATAQSFTAADGYNVADENNVAMSLQAIPFTTALQADRGTTNLLTQAQARCTATTNMIVAGSATLTVDTTHFWESSPSFKVAVSGTSGQLTFNTGYSLTASAVVCFSCYVFSSIAQTFTIRVRTIAGATVSQNFTHPGGFWCRMVASGTLGGSLPSNVYCDVIQSAGPLSYWVDGCQLENLGATGYTNPTAWQDPGLGVRAASSLTYNANLSTLNGFTVSAWVMDVPLTPSGTAQVVFSPNQGTRPFYVEFDNSGSNNILSFATNTDAGSTDVLGYTLSAPPNYGHMVCTLNCNPATGQPTKSIYWNGVLVASNTTLNFSTVQTISSFYVASTGGGNALNGRVNCLQLLPYPVDQNWVSGTYATLTSSNSITQGAIIYAGGAPYSMMGGSCINSTLKQVYGQVTKETYVGFQDATDGWISQGRTITFKLTEV